MSKFIEYMHHGIAMNVREDLKGRHREHCLCYSCVKFSPNQPDNCPIAQKLYEFCCKELVTTPVWECEAFVEEIKD